MWLNFNGLIETKCELKQNKKQAEQKMRFTWIKETTIKGLDTLITIRISKNSPGRQKAPEPTPGLAQQLGLGECGRQWKQGKQTSNRIPSS